MQPNNSNSSNNSQGQAASDIATPVKPKHPNSTQNALKFSELRDDMVIMGDGSFRAVVAAQSINFDLMSNREREGVELSYQDFLNALTFPIQIYIRSQAVDIGPYLEKLSQQRMRQDNMLLGVLMDDYINFISVLAKEANIMDKSFYVIIPYTIGEENNGKLGDSSARRGLIKSLFNDDDAKMRIRIPADKYQKGKEEMDTRVTSVISGLANCGVKAVRLKTNQLGELYYNIYNPDTAIRQPIVNFSDYTTDYVKKGQGEAKFNPLGVLYDE